MKQWLKRNKNNLIIALLFIAVIGGIIGFATFVILSDKNNDELTGDPYIPTGQYALLDLGATSCEPCKRLQPVLTELREEYGDYIDIVFFDITNTTDGAAMANHYKVNIMPTLLFVNKYGREVKRVIGFHSREQIEQIFRELRWVE